MTEKGFGERIHDGMRLRSDDFGEIDGDEFVTYPDNEPEENELDKKTEELLDGI